MKAAGEGFQPPSVWSVIIIIAIIVATARGHCQTACNNVDVPCPMFVQPQTLASALD